MSIVNLFTLKDPAYPSICLNGCRYIPLYRKEDYPLLYNNKILLTDSGIEVDDKCAPIYYAKLGKSRATITYDLNIVNQSETRSRTVCTAYFYGSCISWGTQYYTVYRRRSQGRIMINNPIIENDNVTLRIDSATCKDINVNDTLNVISTNYSGWLEGFYPTAPTWTEQVSIIGNYSILFYDKVVKSGTFSIVTPITFNTPVSQTLEVELILN